MKRFTSQFLALCLFSGLLTGCGSESKVTAETTLSAVQEQSTAAETSIYDTIPTKDLGGMTINIGGYGISSTGESLDTFFTLEETGDVINDAVYRRNRLTEERLNCKLNYVLASADNGNYTSSTYRTKIQANILAGDDTYDVIGDKTGGLGYYMTNGLVREWDGVEGLDVSKPWYPQNSIKVFTVNNRLYSLGSDALATNLWMAWCMAFNKRLADEWKVDDLYDTVESGGWTMDYLMNITKNVYRDLNSNGKKDEADLYGFYPDKFASLDAMMLSHGGKMTSKNADDLPVLNPMTERMISSFEAVYKLWWESEGTFVDTKAYENLPDFAEGRAMIAPMYISMLFDEQMRNMEDDYGVLPYPKLDKQQTEYVTYSTGRYGSFYIPVTITAEKLNVIGYVVETLGAYSHQYLRPAVYENALAVKGTRDERSVEMIDLILENRDYDFNACMESVSGFPFTAVAVYRNLIGAQNNSISSYYDANKAAGETYLSDLMKKLDDVLQ